MLNPYHNASDDAQFRAQMTLWTIARSPLIYGADLRSPSLTKADFALMTNPEALAITNASTKNRPIKLAADAGFVAWAAESSDGQTTYVALVTTTNSPAAKASVPLAKLGVTSNSCAMRDVWLRQDLPPARGDLTFEFPPSTAKGQYQSGLFALTNCKNF